jgi:hypothetical protein
MERRVIKARGIATVCLAGQEMIVQKDSVQMRNMENPVMRHVNAKQKILFRVIHTMEHANVKKDGQEQLVIDLVHS